MTKYQSEFSALLEQENKQGAVEYAIELIQSSKMSVIELYSEVLTPSLNNMQCSLQNKNMCVWKEHVRTAIVRTIVECCYPYVIKERDKLSKITRGTAVVICPPEEYHDLGARIVADYLSICGFDVVFVGSNTPFDDFYNAVDIINPKIIAISVSNYYNLVATKKIIADLRKKIKNKAKIIVGGYAFLDSLEKVNMVDADYYSETFDDIKAIAENEVSI